MILTIGLEIHIKLKSVNKMFCQCKNQQNFDDLVPNTNICPVCTGQPGALPTLSEEVLEKVLLLGKALQCTINETSAFDRKSYFYPDLPMGYQITQLYHPTNTEGQISFFLDNYITEKIVHLQDAHMECDTGKMIHDGNQALLDFNRAGTPLVEIVTKPDFSTTEEVIEFLKELQRIVRFNDIADADLEKGQMRVDVNISLRKSESDPLGTRVEVKNINSFGMIKRAIEHERIRQEKIYETEKIFTQQTRGRNDVKGESYLMRSKEDALDYRYFPEPDLPPLKIDKKRMERLNGKEITIPHHIIKKLKEEYGFNKEYINALIGDKEVLDYFFTILSHCEKGSDNTSRISGEAILGKLIVKRIAGPIAAWMKENFKTIQELPFTKKQFSEFLIKAQKGSLIENQLKIIMDVMLSTGKNPEAIIKEKGFDAPAINESELKTIVQQVLTDNPTIVEQYKGGKTTAIGFFVGQVMKKTGGKANPKTISEMIENLLK
ncbi:MAG: Asp-tRNA(Asn)/Glu-tRNA(Gln) amidotransferase subunit GatB [Candidatus Absconditabacterales bacterium]